jgi:hypothetical protein
MEYATSSLITMRVPSRLPTVVASFQGTPISQAMGEKSVPRMSARLEGK